LTSGAAFRPTGKLPKIFRYLQLLGQEWPRLIGNSAKHLLSHKTSMNFARGVVIQAGRDKSGRGSRRARGRPAIADIVHRVMPRNFAAQRGFAVNVK
jgi:hypothetical protein